MTDDNEHGSSRQRSSAPLAWEFFRDDQRGLANWIVKFLPLAVWFLVIVVVRAFLNGHRSNPNRDAWLLFITSLIILGSVIITLIETEHWYARPIGVLSLLVFSSGIYMLSSSVQLWHWHVITDRDLNWFRSVLIVGAPLLFFSQLLYIYLRIRKRPKEDPS